MTGTNDRSEAELDRLLARLAAAEERAAPRPSEALVARVLADAAGHGAPRAAAGLPPRNAGRGAADRRGAARPRAGGLRGFTAALVARSVAGSAGAAAALAACLAIGFAAGYSGGAATPGLQVAAEDAEEIYVVSDAGAVMFGAEAPF